MAIAERGIRARLLLTVLPLVGVWLAAPRLLVPGAKELVARAQPDGPWSSLFPSNLSIFAVGVAPFVQAYFFVELVAVAVPRWRRLRHGNPDGRVKLDRAARALGVVLAALQAIGIAQQLAALGSSHLFVSGMPEISVPIVTASLVGASCVALLAADLVTRQGIVNGLVTFTAGGLVADVVSGALAAQAKASIAGTWEPRHAVVMFGAIALPIVAGWAALRGTNEARVSEVGRRDGTAYRDARGLVVDPWVPIPSSSIAPYPIAASLLMLPMTLAVWKLPTGGLATLLEEPATYTVALALTTAALAFVFTRILHRPADMDDLARRVGASVDGDLHASVRSAQNRALLPTLLLFAALLVVGLAARSLPFFGVATFTMIILSALAIDAVAAVHARGFVAVWQERRSAAVPVVRAVLHAEGIDVRVTGGATHALFQAWAPYAPATLLVSAADAERASNVLRHLLAGGETPAREPTAAVHTRSATGWSARTRALALAGVLLAGCGLYAVGMMRSTASASAPRRAAKLEVVRVNDEEDVLAELDERALPPGFELRSENVPLGRSGDLGKSFARRLFLQAPLEPGESVERAIARAEPVLKTVAPRAGDRFAWAAAEDIDPDTGTVTTAGIRTYVLTGPAELTNADIVEATASLDTTRSEVYVAIRLTDEGAERFRLLTHEYTNRRLAILLDGRINSAPVVREEIGGGRMSITMGVGDPEETLKEAQALARGLAPSAAR